MEHTDPEPTIESKDIYQGRIIKLRVDTVQLPSGRTTTREIVEHEDAVCVVPIDENNNVLMVRQYRKAAQLNLLEVPAGGVEAGETPDETVLRELQEEVSVTSGSLRRLSGFWVSPGWATEFMHAYLAMDLTPASLPADDDEYISVERVPLDSIPGLIESGEIQDSKSIASLLLALRVLNSD
ncbi:MAG: NUDIX hydrolase [Chloroflexota bacterium]|uniref:Nudix hydrolase domain-containing protein n=1 Tax=marine metagenome TaxID=408172 RepID=A0A382FHP5_9ZZZZ|nr:NUDIX hydrolase [Chloroflexota bacterium]|tara:strand:+ start:2654 stop:3199 length:546 start_codon:yes stop_codon:yes gene_type:complete